MSAPIRVLDDALVDQIAAGEVVERPASVVKELLENALDAEARSISVEIEGGGIDRVRITDDGEGMHPDDARRAVQRHATSKIASFEDLQSIRTLGFRGEALPSIASVSRFTLLTRPRDAVEGTRIGIEGGGSPQVRQAGCAPGTTVEVAELFYNVPARRKFLKKPATESGHITEACLRAALAHPALRLVFVRDGRQARQFLPASSHAERARAAFPSERLTEVATERDGIALRALLGPPEKARAGAGGLHVFVNGRPVKDRALSRAVAFAYGSVLPPGRYPVGVLYLELDPERLDVNVHPQKAEVRFSEGRRVLDAVTRMLATQLGTRAWGGPAARGGDYWTQRLGGGGASGTAPRPPGEMLGEAPDPWGLSAALHSSTPAAAPAAAADGPDRDGGGDAASAALPTATSHAASVGEPGSGAEPTPGDTGSLLDAQGFFGSLRVLGQVRRMMLVCEGADGLHVIDQHAADERVRFHQLRRAYRAREVSTQRLLFPERVECTDAEAAVVDEAREELLAVGLDCTLVGPRTAAIHAVPNLVRRAPPERLLRDVLDEVERSGNRAFGDAVDMALATMACHGAIRAGDPLSPAECMALLRSLDEVDDFSGHCPHGRPIVYGISFGELERRLGR